MTGTVAEEIVDGQAMERLAIDSRVSRLLGDFIEKTSGAHRPPDGRRAMPADG
jgi:hypothetical protein